MKLLINIFFLLIITILLESNVFALSNYQIRKICQNRDRRSKCIKELESKRFNLIKGNKIEIPVVPFKK